MHPAHPVPPRVQSAKARGAAATRPADERGAVLIAALLIAALIAVGLASYLSLNLSTSRLAKRTFSGYAALNLAEAGTEEAVWSYNRKSAGATDAWTGWTTSGPAAWQKFTGFDLGQGVTGSVKVYVDSRDPSPNLRPKIIAQSAVGSASGSPVTKMMEITLRRRSLFANALVAKEAIVFSGANASVDAWNSDPDNNPLTPPVDYAAANHTDHATVASASFVNTAVLLNNAQIWGYVATGGAQPNVGSGGSVRGNDTPAGVVIDPNHIATDFNADFPLFPAPSDGTVLASIPAVLGTAGNTTKWRASQLTLNGNQTLTILGDVTLILTMNSAGDAVSVTGNAAIIIPTGSKLTLFAQGAVRIAGNGLANANVQPISCQLMGTNDTPGGQTVQIAGYGALRAVVYAPNGDVTLNGNGDIMGSVVARSIRLNGNAAFHYDETLAIGQNGEPFTIAKWRELTTEAERAAYIALFQGW